jgi:SAM-dependent methyltransferase
VINFGCGLGYEVMQTALYLRPRLIIGCEYFNYGRAWAYVTEEVQRRYGVEVRFEQLDLRNPIPAEIPQADLLLSFAVLEHLKEMDASLEKLKQFLRPGGRFGSIWGPMWYSYSGDHIAAELGFEHGFDHVLLDDSDYFEFYKSHPRNRDAVRNNEKTWLELGLSNFARYQEYLDSVRRIFGQPTYLLWQVSDEAIKYKNQYPERWKQMLAARPYLTQLDLMLNSVGALT